MKVFSRLIGELMTESMLMNFRSEYIKALFRYLQ